MSGTVRARLTLAVSVGVTGLAVVVALLAPKVVRNALVDDRLDAEIAAEHDALDTQYLVVSDTATIGSAELTALFGPEIADLVDALEPTGAIDELREMGDDDTLRVVPAHGIVATVPAGGTVRVDLVDPRHRDDHPMVTTDRLRSLAGDLDVTDDPMFPADLLDELFGDDMTIDDYLAELDTALGIDLDQWLDRSVLDSFPPFADDAPLPPPLLEMLEQGAGGGADPPAVEPADAGDYVFGIREVDGIDLIVATPEAGVERSVERLRAGLWMAVPLAALATGGITWLLAGRALAPVATITDRTRRIRSGTLHERVPVPGGHDEVAELACEMNEMLDRIEREDVRRRQFVADASHELRSPIAAIRTQAEAAIGASDDADTIELATGVLAEAERMSALVDDLLSIARHDEALAPPGGVVDLDDVVLAEAARPRAVPVDVSSVSAGRVRGRRDELTRVVTHLLDNAARHAAGTVAIALSTTDDTVTLTVDDDGPGVPVDDRERVFDRFVRLDEARRRDSGGAGLGLAVVASVVRAGGGRVGIDDSELGGARFVVTLPAAD